MLASKGSGSGEIVDVVEVPQIVSLEMRDFDAIACRNG